MPKKVRKVKSLAQKTKKWNVHRDPLYRGDDAEGVAVPVPSADPSIVRHILYVGGQGRVTPYLSTSEVEDVARRFARARGKVWRTTVNQAKANSVKHIGQTELLRLLRGKGSGDARWDSAFEVMTARKYVEQWSEHLLDFRSLARRDGPQLQAVVLDLFEAL